jgi:hypothetical protein
MVAQTCNPSTWEAEAKGCGVLDQPGLSETFLKRQNKNVLKAG